MRILLSLTANGHCELENVVKKGQFSSCKLSKWKESFTLIDFSLLMTTGTCAKVYAFVYVYRNYINFKNIFAITPSVCCC